MSRMGWWALVVAAGLGGHAAVAEAAMYNNRNIDGKWYEGRVVSTTYGAYRCQAKFNGDRVYMRIEGSGVQVVGLLEDEVITDPHDILVNDPRRGVNWTLELHDLAR